MEVKILTPTKKLFEGKCQKISFFGVEGKFEVLKKEKLSLMEIKKSQFFLEW